MFYEVVLTAAPHFKSGKLRALAVTAPSRIALLPEVPTVTESGFAGYEALIWYGIVAPRHTPAPVVQRLNTELTRALLSTEMRSRFTPLALNLAASTPQEMTEFVSRERIEWGAVARSARVQIES